MIHPGLFLFLLFMAFVAPVVLASPAEEPEKVKEKSPPVLDMARNFVGSNINGLANRLDSFFATERADDELGRSRLRIRYNYDIRERSLPDDKIRYRINLKLPHLEEKFRFKYFNESDDKDKKKEEEKAVAQEANKAPPSELYKFLNGIKEGWTFNADAGVSVALPPKIVTRARLRRNFEVASFVHRFAEQVTYVTDESGLTEETTLLSDQRWTDTFLFRFVNSKRWRVLKKDFVTLHGPTVLHSLTEDDALSYNLIMTNVLVKDVYYVTSYTLSVNYRRNLYKNWVYLDIIPGIDFPKQWSYRRTPFAIFQLEVLFGG